MAEVKQRVPAVEGWFTMDAEAPALLGSRCKSCGTYFFPKESFFCKNPNCSGTEFDEVPLSRTGKLWSFTNNCYAAPAPFIAPDPFVPYAIAAVELAEERMVVLGQMVEGTEVSDLKAGMQVELVLEKLYEDEASEYMVWKWKPVAA
jgi:uncharacterized OB-fold protein